MRPTNWLIKSLGACSPIRLRLENAWQLKKYGENEKWEHRFKKMKNEKMEQMR